MKTKHIFIGLAMVATATACNESSFLNNPPQGAVSEETLTSKGGAEELCAAAYAALMGPTGESVGANGDSWWFPVNHWTTGSVRADDAYKGGGGTGDGGDAHRLETFQIDATDGGSDGKWFRLCISIQRCNTALRVLNTLNNTEISDIESWKSEMRVLRAHFFFEMQRMFNQIPYYDETFDDKKLASTPNNVYTREQLLDSIATELDRAQKVIPETQPLIGRINRFMVKAYLAKVYLYRAYEQDPKTHAVVNVNRDYLKKVVDLCEEIRNNPRYDLLDDFQQLDLVQFDNSKEMIWDIQYSMNDGTGDSGRINWSNLLNGTNGAGAYNCGDGFFLPSQDLINSFQTDENGLPLAGRLDQDYSVIEFVNGKAKNTKIDNNVDPRLDFIVGRPNVRWKTYTVKPCGNDWVRQQSDYGYNSNKRFFLSPDDPNLYKSWPGGSALNMHMIRYAHVLLWEAEALVELNGANDIDKAMDLVNKIRTRAANKAAWVKAWDGAEEFAGQYPSFEIDGVKYAAKYKIGTYPKGMSQAAARQAVRDESRIETAMEGERFFDLVRWGIAAETMNAYIQHERDTRVYYQNAKFTAGRDEYLPITNNQYKFSGRNYVQNPGYGDF